jgi:hypothetical protein
MQTIELQANAPIHVVLQHSTEFYQPYNRTVLARQGHFGHRVNVVEIHYVDPSLIITPEDTGSSAHVFHRSPKTAGCAM